MANRAPRTGVGAPARTTAPTRAVLWDLDGTLVDSAALWRAAYTDLADRLGAPVGDQGLPAGVWARVVGRTVEDSVVELAAALGIDGGVDVPACARRVVDRAGALVGSGGMAPPWRPGAEQALALAHRLGLPCALVTSSWRTVVDPILEHLGVSFDTVVCGDEVTRPKPAPEAYLRAAARLEVAPEACVVVEDSATGAAAGVAAGARVLLVPSDPTGEVATGTTVRRSLLGLTAADLRGPAAG